MKFRVLYVVCHGYGLALAFAAMASLLGAGALASFLTFWFGGALFSLAIPLMEENARQTRRIRVRIRSDRSPIRD